MSAPVIRKANHLDLDLLVRFNQAMALETEQLQLDAPMLIKGVTAILEDAGKGFYLVCVIDGCVRASLLITSEWSDWRNGLIWWIQSVYVDPAYRRQGLYQNMYQYLQEIKPESVIGFRLYLDQDNTIAQQTYRALGMSPTHYDLYEDLNHHI